MRRKVYADTGNTGMGKNFVQQKYRKLVVKVCKFFHRSFPMSGRSRKSSLEYRDYRSFQVLIVKVFEFFMVPFQ